MGSSITINGSGFSSIPAQNTVTINGMAAQVTYASQNRLVVTVPSGATSGTLEITTQSGSISSSTPFTVVPVSISSFTPASAAPGTTVTLSGGGFDPAPANNTVLINGSPATVSSATTRQLQIVVPSGATPGHIRVTTPLGTGTSSAVLFVPAPGYSLPQIAQAITIVTTGAGHVYTMGAGQVAVALFDGSAGQRVTVLSNNLSVGGNYQVYSPDGSTLASAGISTLTGAAINLPPLPMAGTYAWYFTPGSTPATATFKLQTDLVGGLLTDGTPVATSLSPGQSATYTFSGSAGKSYNLALTQFTGPSTVNASILNPDGSFLVNCGTFQAYYNYTQHCDFTLGTTGTYTLRIVPNAQGLYPSSFNTYVVQDVSATLTAGTPGPAVGINLVANQHALLNFAASANQTLALYFGAPAIQPNGSLQFTLTGPGNTSVTGNSVSTGQNFTWNLTSLAAGNYSVLMAPYSNETTGASAQATLANGVTATLPLDGSTSTQFQTYVPGQAAYFTFAASAGQSLGLALSQLALTPGTVNGASISISKPEIGYYTSGTCYLGTTPACQMSLRNLPQSGNYQVAVTPNGQATMALALTLSPDQVGTLTLGAPTAVNLTSTGQNGFFTFTLPGSQSIVLTGTSVSTSPANTPVTVYVYDSNNNLLQYTSLTTSGVLNLGVLAAGTYSVLVVPNNAATASMSLTVQGGTNAALPLDGSSANLATLAAGQNAYVTFNATAGQSIAVAFSNLTFTPSSVTSATLTIKNPDGSQLWQSTCSAGVGCVPGYRGLPQTGTYTITVTPNGAATMSFGAAASLNYTATLNPGTPTHVPLSQSGQNAMLSFTANAGQSFALQVAGLTTTPANSPVYLEVYNNAGYTKLASTTTTQTATTFNLSNLAAGTYVLWVNITVPGTTNLQVTLQAPQTTAVPTDGTSTIITTGSPGQNAYVTFSANAGDSINVSLTNLVLSPGSPNYTNWTVTAPDGSKILDPGSCYTTTVPGCNGGIAIVPQTGTYRVNVLPQGQQTMSFTATVSQNLTGTITPGTSETLNLTKLGQEAKLNFTVSAGQVLAVSLTGITTVPSSGVTTYLGIYTASGSYVTGLTITSGGGMLNLTNLAAGNYYIWIGPLTAATSTMQLSFQQGVTPTLAVDGTSNTISTQAAGQNAYLHFSATQGDSLNIALTNLSLSPASPGSVSWFVTAPNGSTVVSTSYCAATGPPNGCSGGFVIVPQTGIYTINVLPQGLQTMSFTTTIAHDLTSTITPGTTQQLVLDQLGENARFSFTLTASRSLSISLTGITNVPASGVKMYMSVNSTAGTSVTYIAGVESSSGSESLNVTLGPGNYILWIGPEVPATTTAQLSFE